MKKNELNNEFFAFLILVISITSCSSSFVSTTENKKIKLKPLPEQTEKLTFENELVRISFNKKDIIKSFESDLKKSYNYDLKNEIESLKETTKEKIIDSNNFNGKVILWEYELKFHSLIKKGLVSVYSKTENKYLKQLQYKKTKDKLGGKNAYFYDDLGKELYKIILALGE